MLREAFRVFDHTGDGLITADELRGFVTHIGNPLSEREAEEIIAQVGQRPDGKVIFCLLMTGPEHKNILSLTFSI